MTTGCGDELTNPVLAKLTDATRLLAIAIRTAADPQGFLIWEPATLRLRAWPVKTRTRPSLAELEEMVLELDEAAWLTIEPHPEDPEITLLRIRALSEPLTGSPTSTSSTHSTPLPPPSATSSVAWAGEDPARWPRSAHGASSTLPSMSRPLPEHSRSRQDPRNHATESPVNRSIVGGEGVREWAGARAGAPNDEAPPSSDPPPDSMTVPEIPPELLAALRTPPSSFCPVHPQGPQPGVLCPDCGTARAQAVRHRELRRTRLAAEQLPEPLRAPTIATIDAELQALEAAVDARARPRPAPPTLPGLEPTGSPRFAPAPPDDFTNTDFDQF